MNDDDISICSKDGISCRPSLEKNQFHVCVWIVEALEQFAHVISIFGE